VTDADFWYKISPMSASSSIRSAGPVAALILEDAADKRQQVIDIKRDRGWLEERTADPNSALERMAVAQLLYRAGHGRYVVAPRGTFSVQQVAPPEMLAVIRAIPSGATYFISFLSALIKHGLTDAHSTTIYLAVPQRSGGALRRTAVAGTDVQIVRLSASRWPKQPDREITSDRVLPNTKDVVQLATVERALVDSLSRPDLSGGIETVVLAWTRALRQGVDWQLVSRIASGGGASTTRRVAFLMNALGLDEIVSKEFPDLSGRGQMVPFDRSNGFGMPPGAGKRDRVTGVRVNIPDRYLRGWISGAAIG
jgi:predicted transcriptional regulator of viral defense system